MPSVSYRAPSRSIDDVSRMALVGTWMALPEAARPPVTETASGAEAVHLLLLGGAPSPYREPVVEMIRIIAGSENRECTSANVSLKCKCTRKRTPQVLSPPRCARQHCAALSMSANLAGCGKRIVFHSN